MCVHSMTSLHCCLLNRIPSYSLCFMPEPSPESVFSLSRFQYVFKAEAHGFRTVHEELAKGMTFDLKSNEQSAVRNVLKVSLFSHFLLIF